MGEVPPPERALLIGAGLSSLVELLHLLIPGRFASPFDVAANALGTAAGILFVRTHRLWLYPSAPQRWALCAGAAIAAAAAATVPAILFAPASNGQRLFGHRSPLIFLGLFPYDGVVSRRERGVEPLGW